MLTINELKNQGIRITKIRSTIVEIFNDASSPISALDIKQILVDKGFNVNKSTVYRELNFFKKNKFIKEISFGDLKIRYELIGENCHHHLICDNCGNIEDIKINEKNIIKNIEKKFKFSIQKHSIEFFGVCNSCK